MILTFSSLTAGDSKTALLVSKRITTAVGVQSPPPALLILQPGLSLHPSRTLRSARLAQNDGSSEGMNSDAQSVRSLF
ncbi:hypothetical protein N7G274_004577 [Stereocaulon virgatum]|uniref:Uncharacterized protein n=1 Tax=Stereocaulon virgatum TaxID=373712 RepID=A0ABR4AAB3_9LECA